MKCAKQVFLFLMFYHVIVIKSSMALPTKQGCTVSKTIASRCTCVDNSGKTFAASKASDEYSGISTSGGLTVPPDSKCDCECRGDHKSTARFTCDAQKGMVWNGNTCPVQGKPSSLPSPSPETFIKRTKRGFRTRFRFRGRRWRGFRGRCFLHRFRGRCTGSGSEPDDTDHEAPIFKHCPKLQPVYYTPANEESVVVTWNYPTASDNKGMRRITHSPSMWVSGRAYTEAGYSITYTAEDTSGNKNSSCVVSFQIKVRRCANLRLPQNGQNTCDRPYVIYGANCTFTCATGYKLGGRAVQTCGANGSFSGGGTVTCTVVRCQLIDAPANTEIINCSSNPIYNSICIFRCREGFSFRPNATTSVKCLANQQWSGQPPLCSDSSPPEILNCPLAFTEYTEKLQASKIVTWSPILVHDNVDGNISAELTKGQPPGSTFNVGVHAIEYIATDTANNPSHRCTFHITVEQLRCIAIPFTRKLNSTCSDGNVYGSVCTFSCEPGYPLVGSSSAECEKTSGLPPQTYWYYGQGQNATYCEEKICDALTPPKNGALACDTWTAGSGTHCSISCNKQYDVPRGTTVTEVYTCSTTNGVWLPNNTVPDCAKKIPVTTLYLGTEQHYFSGDCSSDTAQQEIKENFITRLKRSNYAIACTRFDDCKAENVKVTCWERLTSGKKKKSTATHKIRIDYEFTVSISGYDKSNVQKVYTDTDAKFKNITETVKKEVQNGLFDLDITGLYTETGVFLSAFQSELACDQPGELARESTLTCTVCPTGAHYDATSKNCEDCPVGQYQDKEGQLACVPCAQDKSTEFKGTRASSGCIDKCGVGWFSKTGLIPCSKCAVGAYQPAVGSTECLKCPEGRTTRLDGSNSLQQCFSFDAQIMATNLDYGSLNHSFEFPAPSDTITVSGWAMVSSAGLPSYIYSITSDDKQLHLTVGDDSNLQVIVDKDRVVTEITLAGNKFHFIALSFDQSSRCAVSVVFGGQNFKHSLNTCSFKISKDMELSLGSHNMAVSVAVTNVAIWKSVISASGFESMTSSCSYSMDGAEITWADIMRNSKQTAVTVVTPSNCDVTDHCDPNPCNGHQCTDGLHSFRCKCANDYTGKQCETAPDYCRNNACQNGAKCNNGVNGYTCHCDSGYKGTFCEIVNGKWGDWRWTSACPRSCGGAWHNRTRSCNNPAPTPGGEPCPGASHEKVACNTQKCPECTDLGNDRGAYGMDINCTSLNSLKKCTIECREDRTFVNTPAPFYYCGPETRYVWSHQLKNKDATLPACSRARFPRTLETRSFIEINKACTDNDNDETLDEITTTINDKFSPSCVREGTCTTTSSNNCVKQGRKKRDETQTVSYSIKADLSILQMDVNGIFNDEKATKSLEDFHKLLENVDEKMKALRAAIEEGNLVVTVNGQTITATSVDQGFSISCPDNMVVVNDSYICAFCPAGSYKDGPHCVLCAVGTFQPDQGQTSCLQCDAGFTTSLAGAMAADQCSVRVNANTSSQSGDKHSPNPDTVVTVSVSVSVSLVVVAAVVCIAIALYYRARARQRMHVGPQNEHVNVDAPPPYSDEDSPDDVTRASYVNLIPEGAFYANTPPQSTGIGSEKCKPPFALTAITKRPL